jgi:hypothetical protein
MIRDGNQEAICAAGLPMQIINLDWEWGKMGKRQVPAIK